MSDTQSCSNCLFWHKGKGCRMNPPEVVKVTEFSGHDNNGNQITTDFMEPCWPKTEADDWCGKWYLEQNQPLRGGAK